MLWHLFSLNKVATLIRYGNITTVAKICRSRSNLEAKHFFVIWLCFTQIQILPSKKIKPRFVLQLDIFSDNWFYLNAFIFNNIYICIVVCILMQSWRHLNDQILHTFLSVAVLLQFLICASFHQVRTMILNFMCENVAKSLVWLQS